MKDFTLETMLAVFEEIFGRELFWTMAAVAAAVTLAYLYVLVRDRAVSWRKFLLAQLSMPLGAAGAVWFLMEATHSRLSDMGGPVDVIVLALVAVVGAVGLAVLVYTAEALIGGRPRGSRRGD